MSGPSAPGSLPPEVPEEFAAVYWAAYEAALEAQPVGPQHHEGLEDTDHLDDTEHLDGTDLESEDTEGADVEDREDLEADTYRLKKPKDVDRAAARLRESPSLVPLSLMLLALVLVAGAYAVGRMFSVGG